MSRFMKMLNNVSRSQAIYRQSKVSAADLQGCHYAFALAICREAGRSQEDIARELCVNKSTVARNVNYLEERGYVTREAQKSDRRQVSVYPTEKLLAVLPEIKKVSNEWMNLLSEGIPQAELEIFHSVLSRMEKRAREIIEKQEDAR
ncbi:MAG: MarR family transcriptional regulator [Clostridia bacterium]|nr:MarR family transcriptional regulator [Clostridia bacterium]